MNIAAITQQMIILFALLLVGFAANRRNYMNAAFNKTFSGFIIHVSAPALILHSVMGETHLLSSGEIFLLLGLSAASYGLVILLSFLVPRIFHTTPSENGILRFMTIFSNTSFMGFPVVAALLGDAAVFYAAIFGIPFNILMYSYGIRLTSGGKESGFDRKTLLSPCILASVLATVIYLINVPIPEILVTTLGYLSNITIPGAMLIIGSSLAQVPLRTVFSDWRIYALSLFKLTVIPVCMWLILRNLPLCTIIIQVIVIMWALPVAVNCTMLATQYGGDYTLASKGVLISTLLSIVTIPVLMRLLFS